eukprot:g11827.t1
MGRKTPTRKRRVEVKSPVVVNLVESDDDEETDDEEVEFLFEGKLQELDPILPRKRNSRPSEVSIGVASHPQAASSSSSKCKTNKKEAAVGFNKRPFLRRRLRNVHNTLNNPKPFQQERKKRKLGFISSPRSFSDLKSEQEKLFGAAKKKMDEDIRTGILPEKNSQMPRVSNIHSNSTSGKAFVSAVEQHYRELGLKPISTLKEVKNAFRRLALVAHPDKYKIKSVSEDVIRRRNDRWFRISSAYKYLVEALSDT